MTRKKNESSRKERIKDTAMNILIIVLVVVVVWGLLNFDTINPIASDSAVTKSFFGSWADQFSNAGNFFSNWISETQKTVDSFREMGLNAFN